MKHQLIYLFFAAFIIIPTKAKLTFPSWRIVGGQEASDGQFPYQVSLRFVGIHDCGGSILDATTILTAAHCVKGRIPNLLTVSVGNNLLTEQTEAYPVLTYILHENYDPFNISNDIAIIKLAQAINFHEAVKPVKLRQTNIEDHENVILSGWGKNNYPGSVPNELQFINLLTISNPQCSDAHSINGLKIFDTELCTFTKKGEGVCHGDSGGALIDENFEQVGIVSWGNPCARGYPDVFTRVYSYLDWIEANRY